MDPVLLWPEQTNFGTLYFTENTELKIKNWVKRIFRMRGKISPRIKYLKF